MSYTFTPYLSVGIDVGADFSMMSMALPNQQLLGKPFKIFHNRLDSLSFCKTNSSSSNLTKEQDS
jgi:hypothetical protein